MFDELEINPERIPTYKLGIHILQIVLSFVAWCLEIVVFRAKNSNINGQAGWAFAVCFLTIPAWIYLIGAPRFPRTRKFAEPHAMVVVDALFFVIWLSAFAAQAAFNTAGRCGNACAVSKAMVAMGVFICILFGVTTFLSIYTLKYYQFNNRLPGYDRIGGNKNPQNIDPDMAAFSTAPHGEEPYARINDMDDYEGQYPNAPSDYNSNVGGYGGAGSTVGGSNVGTNVSSNVGTNYGADTSYVGADSSYLGADSSIVGSSGYGGGSAHLAPHDNPFDDHSLASGSLRPAASASSLNTTTGHSTYAPPTVHDAYEDGRPVRFPEADYDRH